MKGTWLAQTWARRVQGEQRDAAHPGKAAMQQAEILDPHSVLGEEPSDENTPLARAATTTVALGHLMLLLPLLAGLQDMAQFRAYYLAPSILAVWLVGLALDMGVVATLFVAKLNSPRWLTVTAVCLGGLAALPWLELYLGSLFEYGVSREMMPLPWATTHLGPVGSATALVALVLALRARSNREDAPLATLIPTTLAVLCVQGGLYLAFRGWLF